MCTTYTWLAYSWPEQQRPGRPTRAPAMTATLSSEAGRRPQICPAAAASAPRPRRARHWVGLAIVGVQMAAWCLVGALLMHRGVSNLQRRDAALQALQAAAATTPSTTTTAATTTSSTTTATSWPPMSVIVASRERDDDLEDGDAATPSATVPEDRDDLPEGYFIPPQDAKRRWMSGYLPMRPPPGPVLGVDLGDGRSPLGVSPTTPPGHPGGQTARVAGTGAATAVVMVTVGGVMLVVGPAFMFIKIMDVYQRQKRLNKMLSRQDDPPPSYEEVAEKAPRYSALFQVLESGELTPLSLLGTEPAPEPEAGPEAVPEVVPEVEQVAEQVEPERSTAAAAAKCTSPSEEETEADVCTPLRQGATNPSCSETNSRRRSV